MKSFFLNSIFGLLFYAISSVGIAAEISENTVVLDETGVKNLRIQTQIISASAFEESIFALGRIEALPEHRAVISSRIPGRVTAVNIRQGHPVEKGDTAMVVESRQPGDPPPSIRLQAPISGIVSTVGVAQGEPVEPDRALAEVLNLHEVYAMARVPEHLAAQLKIGQPSQIIVPAVPGEIFEAHLEHLGAIADRENGTIEAAFHLKNKALKLRPGMRVEFSIVINESEKVFSIPRTALQGDAASRFVYVKNPTVENTFTRIPVVAGRMSDRSVEIVSGLKEGDEVVTHGAYSLAFAGEGTVSLKAALDAAHGHEHADDGSEIDDSKAHLHEHEHEEGSLLWKTISGILFVVLIITMIRKRGGSHVE